MKKQLELVVWTVGSTKHVRESSIPKGFFCRPDDTTLDEWIFFPFISLTFLIQFAIVD